MKNQKTANLSLIFTFTILLSMSCTPQDSSKTKHSGGSNSTNGSQSENTNESTEQDKDLIELPSDYPAPGVVDGGDCSGQMIELEPLMGRVDIIVHGTVSNIIQTRDPLFTVRLGDELTTSCEGLIVPGLEITLNDVTTIKSNTRAVQRDTVTFNVGARPLDSWQNHIRSTGEGPTDYEWVREGTSVHHGQEFIAALTFDDNNDRMVLSYGLFQVIDEVVFPAYSQSCPGEWPDLFVRQMSLAEFYSAVENVSLGESEDVRQGTLRPENWAARCVLSQE